MIEILLELSSSIDVPAAHAAEQRVPPAVPTSGHGPGQLIRIHSGADRPQDSFVAVRYREHWSWIDDRDLYSKPTFSILMALFTLTETTAHRVAPVVTVPAH